MTHQYPTIIIGAGMAGMAAARTLVNANLPVLVLDKGRGISGRMATRRWGDATFDHGAQYFSAKTTEFQTFVKNAAVSAAIKEWWPDIGDAVHPRWIGASGMNAMPKLLEENIPILKSKQVVRINENEKGWEVQPEDDDTCQCSSLLVTIPAPQALQLLENSGITLEESPLPNIAYHPCLVVMARLDKVSGIPAPGGLKVDGGVLSWLADNFQKGISQTPSVTVHATPEFSYQHLDGDLQAAGQTMIEAATALITPAKVVDWQVHRWRYSLCHNRHDEPFWKAGTRTPLLFGGDGFGMGNVEGAYISGIKMAEKIARSY